MSHKRGSELKSELESAQPDSSGTGEETSSRVLVSVAVGLAPQLGAYTYWAPGSVEDLVGRSVLVPFGERRDWGVVVGEGDDETELEEIRDVLEVGPMVLSPKEVELVEWAALRWCGLTSQVALRAVPKEILRQAEATNGRGRDRKIAGEFRRQYRMCAPGLDLVEAGAEEVEKLLGEQDGRILVLCATGSQVSELTKLLAAAEIEVQALQASALEGAEAGWGWGRGWPRVLVGTRHHGLWPVRNLGGIVVIDGEHPGHRAPKQPYTHTRDLAVRRSQLLEVSCVILGRVPGPEAFWGGIKAVEAGSKQRHWPTMEALRYNAEAGGGFGARIREAVRAAVARGDRVAVVWPGGDGGWFCGQCRAEWTCRRCGNWVKIGGCGCQPRPDAPRCGRCRSERRVVRGWAPERIRRELPKIEEGYDVVARSEFWGREAGAYDLVVFVEADERRGVGADPGLDIGRVLVEVARVTNPGGRLIFHNAQRGGVAEALAEKRSVRGTVRRSWEQAKAEGLPPFGREVRVEMTGPKPPRPGWQLRTHGPKKVESGWELLIRCRDEDLEDVREWIQAERRDRRRRLRVEVF